MAYNRYVYIVISKMHVILQNFYHRYSIGCNKFIESRPSFIRNVYLFIIATAFMNFSTFVILKETFIL